MRTRSSTRGVASFLWLAAGACAIGACGGKTMMDADGAGGFGAWYPGAGGDYPSGGGGTSPGGGGGYPLTGGSAGVYPMGGSAGYPLTGGSAGYPLGGSAGSPLGGSAGYPPTGASGGVYPYGGSAGAYPMGGSAGYYPPGGSGAYYPTGGSPAGGAYPIGGAYPGGAYPIGGAYPAGTPGYGGVYPVGGTGGIIPIPPPELDFMVCEQMMSMPCSEFRAFEECVEEITMLRDTVGIQCTGILNMYLQCGVEYGMYCDAAGGGVIFDSRCQMYMDRLQTCLGQPVEPLPPCFIDGWSDPNGESWCLAECDYYGAECFGPPGAPLQCFCFNTGQEFMIEGCWMLEREVHAWCG
jgi:hypothetical protein